MKTNLTMSVVVLAVFAACGGGTMGGTGGGSNGSGGGTSGGGSASGGGTTSISAAKTLTGNVSANVLRVGLLTRSGKVAYVDVVAGKFTAPIPSESYAVVFYGKNHRVLANLAAKPGATSTKLAGVFPAPRIGTGMNPLTSSTGVQRDPLLVGTEIQLGTVTVTTTVTTTVTVQAQYNLCEDIDTDGDGQNDYVDADDDGDGTSDDAEAPSGLDVDGDGSISLLDDDDDNDGMLDAVDTDDDGDGVLDSADSDQDGDGIQDSVDLDDDEDGILDADESTDSTPDILVGSWTGTTEVTDFSFATGRPVRVDEVFVLSADGTMTGDFVAVDATSGCHVAYQLAGTWADVPDTAAVLNVEWTSVKHQIVSCTDAANNVPALTDVTAAEKDIWDNELDGIWYIDANRLTIVSPAFVVVADYDRTP
jgi:hypothetical protein